MFKAIENSEAGAQSLKNATNLLHIHTTIGFVEIKKEFDCMRGSETPKKCKKHF